MVNFIAIPQRQRSSIGLGGPQVKGSVALDIQIAPSVVGTIIDGSSSIDLHKSGSGSGGGHGAHMPHGNWTIDTEEHEGG